MPYSVLPYGNRIGVITYVNTLHSAPAMANPLISNSCIDQCHERNISVLLDIVLNHFEAESPLTKIDYDYWYRREAKDPDNSWGPEF